MSNSQNNNGSNSGFSLMTSLGGVIGSNNPSGSGGNASASTPAARLREGLTAMVSSPSNNSASSSFSKTSGSPSGIAVPLGRASNSFSSSSTYHQQLNQKQQQQRRRVPAYRTGHQSNSVPPQKHQHQQMFSGISPNYSMDSDDRRGGRDSSAESILKASSFDDCYKQNSTGFHDAFALLSPQNNDGAVVNKYMEISGNASSPAREKRRNFFPSSPLRSKNQHSPEHKTRPASAKSAHATVDGDSNNQHQRPISSMSTPVKNRHIGSVSSPPNTPPSTGNPATSAHSNNSIGPTSGLSQIASSIMSSPDKESSPSMFPPPPSGIKSKHLRDGYDAHATNAAISTSSTRHASPMAPSRMKHTLQKTWNKAKATTKGSIGVGHHVRQRSKGSGSYSEAVTEALKIENDDADKGIGAIVLDTGARKSAGDSAIESSSSQGGIEVISPVSMNSFNNSGGKIGKRLNRLRTRTRSPSPIRDLEGNLLSVDGSNVNTANDESKISSEFMTNNHGENESETTTPSFFRKSPNIRAMSPARMKKNLKKRLLAIPPSSRHDHSPQSHQPQDETSSSTRSLERSRQRDSPRLPLHPSTEVISNHSEEDDALEDVANLSLVNTSMSFDVDDYETSVLEEDKLHADSDAMTEVASNKTGSTSAPSITVNPSSSKNTDERTINEKPHPNNIFECDDFVRAMGGANEAALATNYIRTGDSLCTVDKRYDRAIPAYYAGLGAILSRTRRWGLNQCDDGFVGMDTSAPGTSAETPNIFHEYFQRIAFSMDMNILLLAMSSILLRAGNAHFHLNHWEVACQDYVSAEFYRSLRFSAFSPRETGRQKGRDDGDRKVALNNAINHDEWNGVSAVLEGLISNNMASAKSNRQMYEEARAEYTEALRIKQSALQALHGDNSQEGEPTPSSLSTHVKDDDLVSDIATTLHNIGLLRSKCGEPKKAEKAFTQSLSLRVKKFGLDDPGVSTTLRALGDLYFNEKRYDDSFRSYKESLRICKLHCGKPDLNAAELYYNIGLVFYSKGPYSKSKVSIMECLRIRRERCGNNNLNTASALYLLGLISSAMGEYDDAIIQFEEALAIRRNIIGIKSPNHLLMINVHVALGNVHQLNGDFDSAMDSYSLCLKERSERLGKHHPSVSEVLQLIGVAYITAAEYSKALETLEEALRIRQSLLGPSMEVAETLDSLGLLYFKSGDTEKAVELSEDSLSVLKSAVGFDHVLVSKVLKNIGDYYQDAEVYDDAIEAYSESIRVKTLWYGRDHTSLAEVLNEMGITRFKKGDYMIARQSFSQALRIMRADKNASNKSLIFPTLTHLGHALYKNRDFKLATETYLESFNIQVSIITGEENLGIQGFSEKLTSIAERAIAVKEDDSDFAFLSESLGGIASILRYLGLVYQEQGDIETALTVNKLSLSVRLSQPYKEYSAIALMAETIAMFEFKRANLNSALEYFNQALHAKKSYQGDSTIDVARTVNNLANIHFSLGNLDDAMKLYQDALEIKRLCLGNDSDEVANTLNNIAHVMVTAGKEQEALQAYHNVVRIRQDRYGKNHSSVATTLASMGDVYIKLGKLEIAMTYFEQCIRIQKLNQDHCDERVLENLASIYGKLGEWHKAESAFKEIVQLKRSVQGEDSLEVAKSLDLLAVSYIEQDRCVDSIEHLKEALRIRKACLSGEDGEILASLNKLAFVYKSCEMTTEMMDVKAEFDRIQNLRKK